MKKLVILLPGAQTKERKDEKKIHKYKGKKDFKIHKSYKEKGKKNSFMVKDSDNSEDEIVYIVVKYKFDDEGDMMSLISHISRNDTWIIDSGCSHHMTRNRKKV